MNPTSIKLNSHTKTQPASRAENKQVKVEATGEISLTRRTHNDDEEEEEEEADKAVNLVRAAVIEN